jgi:hypothetical protein
LRPRADGDAVMYATKLAMRTLGRRVLVAEDDIALIDRVLEDLVVDTAPGLLALYGVGTLTAAVLLSRRATTRNGSATKRRGRCCAESRRWRHRRASRSNGIA